MKGGGGVGGAGINHVLLEPLLLWWFEIFGPHERVGRQVSLPIDESVKETNKSRIRPMVT